MAGKKKKTTSKPKSKATPKKKTKPLGITDTTFRDSHQSSLATRLRIEDMIPIAEEMDQVGFRSMEVWGGATFDVTTRFLNEDPWGRIRTLKKYLKKTPLQMLLRGQNLVGYRNYPDDVVRAFIRYAVECGISVFRVFDALNDERNFETSFETIKECGAHIQGCISYSLTNRRLGGKIYDIDYFVNKAKIFEKMGAHSLCIKDMAGLISPYDAYDLVRALKENLAIPVQLHTHYTSGMGSMSYLKAIEAGVDVVDTALAPFALRSSQPAVEPLVAALNGTGRDPKLDLSLLFKLGQYLETIAPKYRQFLDNTKMSVIDTGVLMHQIPGGMLTNLVSQLREAEALDRIQEVYEELPRTRKELGYPPLVTPTSQIVGIQAVQNVLFGRYKMISSQVRDYAYGLYGTPPVPMNKDVQKKALEGYERGTKPIKCRAADKLEPELDKAKEAVKGIAKNIGDELIYALYPVTGMRFLKWKYGMEEVPDEVKPKSLEDVKKEDELVAKARAGVLVEKKDKNGAPQKGPGVRTYNVFVEDDFYSVAVEEVGGQPVVRSVSNIVQGRTATASTAPAATSATAVQPSPAAGAGQVKEGEVPLKAPMPGMVIDVKVSVGDKIKEGEVLIVLEAMKMQNNLTAPASGVVKKITHETGTAVEKNELLVIIGSE